MHRIYKIFYCKSEIKKPRIYKMINFFMSKYDCFIDLDILLNIRITFFLAHYFMIWKGVLKKRGLRSK